MSVVPGDAANSRVFTHAGTGKRLLQFKRLSKYQGVCNGTMPSLGMIRVLIVDDHPAIRRMIRQLLSQHEQIRVVAEASSGSEALECVRTLKPDMMTLDMMMGDMNGLEVLSRLKVLSRRPKAIVVSLYHMPQMVQKALEGGADAYIHKKKLTPSSLLATIERVTGQKI